MEKIWLECRECERGRLKNSLPLKLFCEDCFVRILFIILLMIL